MSNNPQPTGMQPVQHRMIGHVAPPPIPPPMPMQFRPVVPPPPQPPSFIPVPPQQFQPVGHPNMGMLPHPPPLQGPHPQPPNRPMMSVPPQLQPPNNYMPNYGGPRISHIPYNPSSGGQPQMNAIPTAQHLPFAQTDNPSFSAGGQPWYPTGNQDMQSTLPLQPPPVEQSSGEQIWFSSGNRNMNPVTPLTQNAEQNDVAQQQSAEVGTNAMADPDKKVSSDWREHTSRDGKKFFYSRKRKISSWEKPLELMTPNERADATTDWREFTTKEGRRFYHNKRAKISKWAIPEEVKLAREKVNMNMTSFEETPTVKDVNSYPSASVSISVSENEESAPNANNLSSSAQETVSSPVLVAPAVNSEPDASSTIQDDITKTTTADETTAPEVATSAVVSDTPVRTALSNAIISPKGVSEVSPLEAASSSVKISTVSSEESNKSAGGSGSGEGIKLEHEALVYESKEEAKNAFKALLESANVASDWTWDQAMRVIINDRRYGALRSLGERKQTFNEFVGQKRKHEAEEKRSRQKKAKQDFKKMLQEASDLTSTMRWSKAISMFEKDERFHAMERAIDREDLFDEHLKELKNKERAKALEENKRNKVEYMEFLKSCDFIKASSQWRKVQHRLEADERCSRLDKMDRFEVFQEYTRDLEMEEEEQRKLRMDEIRKAERKNRDEFRKLMEEHVSSGIITAKSHWRDYCIKVKDAPAYLAVYSNTVGSTAKDLFEDVLEDLEKQYAEDKEEIERAIKNEKISLSTSWTLEDFKGNLPSDIISKPISDVNLKLIFDELLDIIKEKEEKGAKKRKRLAEDVYEFLFNAKEITLDSKWEEFIPLIQERFVGEESFFREIFNNVILELKTIDKERKRKADKAKKERKDKEKKERRRRKSKDEEGESRKERRKTHEADSDESKSSLEESRRSRDRSKKHKKWHRDAPLDDDERDRPRSHRHGSSSKKSKHDGDFGDL